MSDSPELVGFAIGLVNFVLKLPDGQVKFFGGIQITEKLRDVVRSRLPAISPAEKEFTTSSNCKQKQRHGGILEMQLSKKAGLTIKKPAYLFLSFIPENCNQS